MFVKEDLMPGDSRIWIYQSDREFTTHEVGRLGELALRFVEGWTAHDNALRASFALRYGFFLILMIDEKQALASGCSIDKSVNLVRAIEKDFNVSMLNRQLFAWRKDNAIHVSTREDFEKLIGRGEITPGTIVFNNLVERKYELPGKWELKLKDSWHAQLFHSSFQGIY